MKHMLLKWLSVSIIFVLLLSSQPVISVQAGLTITDGEIWSGFVNIDQDVIIPSGVTLTVETGATILMACSDAGDIGYDPDRIEIFVEDGGTLIADGATFAGNGYPMSNCWYGINFEEGSLGYIRNSNIRDGMRAVYVESAVEISGNVIQHMYGKDGTSAASGGTAWGIVVDAGVSTPLIANNEILRIYGGPGWDADSDQPGTHAGSAYGIFVHNGTPTLSGNTIHMIYGGEGGDGGNGSDGLDGRDGSTDGENGVNGAPGEPGQEAGLGGIAAGINISNATGAVVTGNEIYAVHSGAGGNGGNGGDGGDGGDGATGAAGSTGDNGGVGGSGGDGGVGGNGAPSRESYGIYDTADLGSVNITQNLIYNIQSGMPGLGGAGGNGGLGGAGGQGGPGTSLGGEGGSGGVGGDGGEAGRGGNAGRVNCFQADYASLGEFSQNRFSWGIAADGNAGGLGGSAGDGGAGGSGGSGAIKGNGGDGGAGGAGAAGGEGGKGGMIAGVYLKQLDSVTEAFTNNVVNDMEGGQGGSGGNGGDGGLGGNGGVGATAGAGGNGGDAGDGSDGGDSSGSYLFYIWDTTIDVINNTLYLPKAPLVGGAGGSSGIPGLGGTGATTGTTGDIGATGTEGNNATAAGMTAFYMDKPSMVVNLFNNIFMGLSFSNTIGLIQGSDNTAINVDYNDFWNWNQAYLTMGGGNGFVYGINNINLHPFFQDAANNDFHLTESSNCIDKGYNSATGVPAVDFDGNPRPFNGIVDMGAFEFGEYTLTVQVDPEEKGTVTIDPEQVTYRYDEQVTLTPNPIPGWSFSSWSGDASGTDNPLIVSIQGNTTITANFTQDEFKTYLPLIIH